MDRIEKAAEHIVSMRKDMRPHHPHTCRRDVCNPLSEMDLLDSRTMGPMDFSVGIIYSTVYVCRYGQIHVCTQETCDFYSDTKTGVCPLTGIDHGILEQGRRGYVPPEKRTAHLTRADFGKRRAGRPAEREAMVVPSVAKAAAFAQKEDHRQNVFGLALGAVMQTNDADGMEEAEEMTDLPRENDVYEEDDEEEQVNYDDDEGEGANEKDGKRKPPSRGSRVKKKRSKTVSVNGKIALSQAKMEEMAVIAEDIIVHLLYSEERRLINLGKKAEIGDRKAAIVQAYYDERQGKTFPIYTEVLNLIVGYTTDLPNLATLRRREDRIEAYKRMILRTWEIVVNSPWGSENPGYRFEAHALTVLYRMRRGMRIDGVEMIPRDVYMYYLPNRIDLPLFGERYESSTITAGAKNLAAAYASEIKRGTLHDDLVVRLMI